VEELIYESRDDISNYFQGGILFYFIFDIFYFGVTNWPANILQIRGLEIILILYLYVSLFPILFISQNLPLISSISFLPNTNTGGPEYQSIIISFVIGKKLMKTILFMLVNYFLRFPVKENEIL